MSLGVLFLDSISTGIITSDELNWITNNLINFSRLEFLTAVKLGQLLDDGKIKVGCRME